MPDTSLILLVDDDEDYPVLLRALLEDSGATYRLDWQPDYGQALAAMAANSHDLYLVDYRLGAQDGLSLVREARRRGCAGPVVFLSGQGNRGVDLEAMSLGASEYLNKSSLSPDLLERTLRYTMERHRRLAEVEHARSLLEHILAGLDEAVFAIDPATLIIRQCNPMAGEMFGYPAETLMGQPCSRLFLHGACPVCSQAASQEPHASHLREAELVRADGSGFPGEVYTAPVMGSGTSPEIVILVVRDLTEKKLAEQQLMLAARVFEGSQEGILVTDADQVIVSVNDSVLRITGYTREELLGQTPGLFRSGHHDDAFYREMWRELDEGGHWQGEIWNRRKDGNIYPEWLSITRIKGAGSDAVHYIGIFSDITERKAHEQRIEFLSHYHPLTGLANRDLLHDRLEQAVSRAIQERKRIYLLQFDIDRFKHVNDSLGHQVGDALLKAVAERISSCVREGDTLAHLGGDEFAMVLSGYEIGDATGTINCLWECNRQPYQVAGREFAISFSLGVSVFPEDGASAETLMKNADSAMFHAKEAGRNTYRFFTNVMNEQASERLNLESHLRLALERKEFLLHYQPQVDAVSGRIVGAEALLRWPHPEMGLVPPGRFIPVAEDSGLIVEIGEWVLKESCRQNRAWQDARLPAIPVAVNLSAAQFRQRDLTERIWDAIRAVHLEPSYLELEITESLAMENAEETAETLVMLKSMGVRIAIDDFGTGYSSLNHLKRFPIDKLKIDMSFVRDIAHDADDRAISRMIVDIAHTMRLKVIAEGVETEQQLEILRDQLCDEIQGYYFSRPLPPDQFADLLRRLG